MKPKSAAGLLGFLSLFCLLFTFIVWFGGRILYAYGAAWYSFLSFLLFLLTLINIDLPKNKPNQDKKDQVFAIDTPTIPEKIVLFKKRSYSIVTLIFTVVAFSATVASFIVAFFEPPKNGSDSVAKPIFTLIALGSLFAFFLVSIYAPTSGSKLDFDELVRLNDAEMAGIHEEEKKPSKGQRCGLCCGEACIIILMFLFVLAGAYTFITAYTASQFRIDFDPVADPNGIEEIVIKIQVPVFDSFDAVKDVKMSFRCAGPKNDDVPVVLLHHGWTGQGLDFAWTFEGLRNSTRVCMYDRPAYARSELFGPRPRTSEQIANELMLALNKLTLHHQTTGLVFVGHSFAGFNMRVFDLLFPGVIRGMVMVDPVSPEDTDECFPGGDSNPPAFYMYLAERVIPTGLMNLLGALTSNGIFELFGPVKSLPENVQEEYIHNNLKTETFTTAIDEAVEWGKSCALAATHNEFDFPLAVIIPEFGIYEGHVEDGLGLENLSENSTSILVVDDEASHVGMMFVPRLANIIVEETLNIIQQLV